MIIAAGTLFAWLLNTFYAASALALVLVSLTLFQRYMGGRLQIRKELFKGNIAVAIVVAAVVIGVCFVVGSAHASTYTSKYDHHFKKNAHHYFARGLDWQWFKAQGIAESSLKPGAVSPAGAAGIMQIMPATWDDIMGRGTRYLCFSPSHSIKAGIAYDRWLWDKLILKKENQRRKVMFAAYNAGIGNIGKARARCHREGWSENWPAISCHLLSVTGRNAMETSLYLHRIERHYTILISNEGERE